MSERRDCPECGTPPAADAVRCLECGLRLSRGSTRLLGRLIGPYQLLRNPEKTAQGMRYDARDTGSGKRVTVLVPLDEEPAHEDVDPDASPEDPRLGRVLADTYRLAERIGVGGMGIVYRAWDIRLRRRVAVKLLTEASQLDDRTRERFASEARVLAGIGHPNVVRVFDVGRAGGVDFFAMELLPGPSLADWIQAQAPDEATWRAALDVSPEALQHRVRWVRDAAWAVHDAHEAGVVHRDLKPGNLMLDGQEHVRVLDFGLAHVSGEEKTRTRARLGTPRYMAPEQIVDPKRVDRRADVYSLGLTLYSLLCLQKPFADAEDEHEILSLVSRGALVPLQRRNQNLPLDLVTVVTKALEVEPDKRYATAAQLADELDRWLSHRPVQARPASTLDRARKYVRREPVQALGFLVLLLSVVLLGTINRQARTNARARAGEMALQHVQAVERGDPTGMTLFARQLEELGMEREALLYYERAAEAGNARAMYELGRLLLTGAKELRNEVTARYWLGRAAEHGETRALELLKER